MIAIAVIVFMLMLPKQSAITKGVVQDYQSISKSEYTFEATKAISSEPLKKQYSISSDDMNSFKSNSQYKLVIMILLQKYLLQEVQIVVEIIVEIVLLILHLLKNSKRQMIKQQIVTVE